MCENMSLIGEDFWALFLTPPPVPLNRWHWHFLHRQPSASHSTMLPWRYLKPGECVRGFHASPSNNPSKPQAASQQWSTRAPVRIGENKLTTVRTTADGNLLPGPLLFWPSALVTVSTALPLDTVILMQFFYYDRRESLCVLWQCSCITFRLWITSAVF